MEILGFRVAIYSFAGVIYSFAGVTWTVARAICLLDVVLYRKVLSLFALVPKPRGLSTKAIRSA